VLFQLYIYLNPRTKLRKGLIFYYKTSGITCSRKHIDANHSKKINYFDEEINFTIRGSLER